MDNKKDKIANTTINLLSNTAGQTAGTVIGGTIAGFPGAIVGGAAGALTQTLFERIGQEIKKRYLSPKENERISIVYDMAYKKITKNKYQGKKLRDAEFFESDNGNRSSAEEILEGVLLSAQREYEERKLPYLANLYANICFDQSVTREIANELLKIANELSYRKLVVLKCVSIYQLNKQIPLKPNYNQVAGIDNIAIATDTYRLYQQGLISSKSVIFDPAGIDPAGLAITGLGALLYNNMELTTLPVDTLVKKTFSFFSNYEL